MPDETQPASLTVQQPGPAQPEPVPPPPAPGGRWVWVADTPQSPQPAPAPIPATQSSPASPAAPQPRFSKLSLLSLLFALLWLPCLLAILCGHIARGRIRRAGGALTGGGVALLGLLLGYLGVFAGVVALAGGLWLWRASSDVRAEIAAGRNPAEAIVNRFGAPVVEGILKSEALLPAGVRGQINQAFDESADQRLSLAGQWMLQQAAANNGRLPDTLAGFGKNAAPPASPTSSAPSAASVPSASPATSAFPTPSAPPTQPGTSDSGPAMPDIALMMGGLDLSAFGGLITRGLKPVPGLDTANPPETVILHYARPLADGTVPAFLLNGSTVRLQPGDPRLATLALEK